MKKKICRGCGRNLPIEEFPKHPQMKDGHLNYCKECTSQRKKKYYRQNREQVKETVRKRYYADLEKNRKAHRECYYRHRKENRKANRVKYWENSEKARRQNKQSYIRHRAKRLAECREYRMSERGREVLLKAHEKEKRKFPDRIQARCAVANAVRDGRLRKAASCARCPSTENIEAHHHRGYAPEHWLNVVWLCRTCHRKADGRAVELVRDK